MGILDTLFGPSEEEAVDTSTSSSTSSSNKDIKSILVGNGVITQEQADSLSDEAIQEVYNQYSDEFLESISSNEEAAQSIPIQIEPVSNDFVSVNGVYVASATSPPPVISGPSSPSSSPTAATATATEPTAEQKATDERIQSQCILIDFISELSETNYDWRTDVTNTNNIDGPAACGGGGTRNFDMLGMFGDGDTFSSLINGSQKKAKFLEFTTAQLSSLTPVVTLYKVQQTETGKSVDYLIPFPTHAAWLNSSTNSGQLLKNDKLNLTNFDINNPVPVNVGLKSFDWQFEGSNPVSSKVDIKAKLVLFAKSLADLIEKFKIPAISGGAPDLPFQYVDLILRSGKKFTDSKQYDPKYYRIKIQIGWKTGNTSLFSDEQLESLKKNTTTLILTLIDHEFEFEQDGSVKLNISYRAYIESTIASQDADFIRTAEQQQEVDKIRQKLYDLNKILSADAEEDDGPSSTEIENAKKEYETTSKQFETRLDELNQEAFSSIIDELNTRQAIYYVNIKTSDYVAAREAQLSGDFQSISSNILNRKPASSEIAESAKEAIKSASGESNPNLTSLVPAKTDDGTRTLSFFYLGDLFAIAIQRMYLKMSAFTTPDGNIEYTTADIEKPKFLFGSALFRDIYNPSNLKYVNILDVPVSVEWFTEWFSNEIISQQREIYPLLYFIRDLSSKLIDSLVTSRCDTSNALKNKNKLNTLYFNIKKYESLNIDPLSLSKFESNVSAVIGGFSLSTDQSSSDVVVDSVGEIVNAFQPEYGDVTNLQEYVAIYCQDRKAPNKIDCEDDEKKGRYHFYFGRDRGIVKKINFKRTQVTGLRELNYVRESSGLGLEQLMTPYDLDITMVGNNLMYNGMMIFVNPSGFGRKIGQPNDPYSVSYKLKLGGYHLVYRVENILGLDGFETRVKAKWIGSGYSSSLVKNDGSDTGNIYGAGAAPSRDYIKG